MTTLVIVGPQAPMWEQKTGDSRPAVRRFRLPVRLRIPLALALVAAQLTACSGTPEPELPNPTSLYARLGGMDSLRRLVDELVWRVAADPELGPSFASIELGGLKARMLVYLCAVAEGPCRYDSGRLVAAHRNRAIASAQVDRFLDLVSSAITALELPGDAGTELIERLERARSQIVTYP